MGRINNFYFTKKIAGNIFRSLIYGVEEVVTRTFPGPLDTFLIRSNPTPAKSTKIQTTLEHDTPTNQSRSQIASQCGRLVNELINRGFRLLGTDATRSAGSAVVFSISGDCLLFNLGDSIMQHTVTV